MLTIFIVKSFYPYPSETTIYALLVVSFLEEPSLIERLLGNLLGKAVVKAFDQVISLPIDKKYKYYSSKHFSWGTSSMTSSNQGQNNGCLYILMPILLALLPPLILQNTQPYWWEDFKKVVASRFTPSATPPIPSATPPIPSATSPIPSSTPLVVPSQGVTPQNLGQSISKCSPPNNANDKCFIANFPNAETRGIYSDTTGQSSSKIGAVWRGDEVLLLHDKVANPSSGSWYKVRVIKSGKQTVGIEGWIRSSYIE